MFICEQIFHLKKNGNCIFSFQRPDTYIIDIPCMSRTFNSKDRVVEVVEVTEILHEENLPFDKCVVQITDYIFIETSKFFTPQGHEFVSNSTFHKNSPVISRVVEL